MKKPLLLMILDGFGINNGAKGNAIEGNAPNIYGYMDKYPTTRLNASGLAVGLPDGQMGNSEVGHTNIGAGRIVYQELVRITKSVNDGDFFENPALLQAVENAKKNNTALHLMGLLSDGGVHSHIDHLYALLALAKKNGLEKVYVHAIMDGRDVSPTSGAMFIKNLEDKLNEIGVGKIASVIGRYYAMDRDNRWDRVEKAYDALVKRTGVECESALECVENSYAADITDEFILPSVIKGGAPISENDSVVFFNFRPDRAREITRVFVDKDFIGFPKEYFNTTYVCMTQYDAKMPNVSVAFLPNPLTMLFGEYISQLGMSQLRIAETEKYAHVTFFFNGGREAPYENEDRVLIPSPKVATYDLQPEMSANQVCDAAKERILSGKYDVIVLNFANCDMVGHTGSIPAAVAAVKTVDGCAKTLVDAVMQMGGTTLITADHGNADKMLDDDGSVFTAHSTNQVPFVVIGKDVLLKEEGCLGDIAPTMLDILNVAQPKEMTGESLIVK